MSEPNPYVGAYPEMRSRRRVWGAIARYIRRDAPEVDTLIESGRTAFRNEDLQSALDLWRNALLIDPANERAQAYVRRAERQLQNLERLRSEPTPVGRGG